MASYADLIREYKEETKYSNSTFTDICECIDSLGIIAHENVNLDCTISIAEVNFDDVKNTVSSVAKKVITAAKNLKSKIIRFIEKLGESIRRLVDKAKVIVANKGNATMAKLLDNDKAVVKKDVEIVTFDDNAVFAILAKCSECLHDLNEVAKYANFFNATLDKAEDLMEKYKDGINKMVEILSQGRDEFDKATTKKVLVKKDTKVKEAYKTHLSKLMEEVDIKNSKSLISICEKNTKEVTKRCNQGTKELDDFINRMSKKEQSERKVEVMQAQTLLKIYGNVYSNTMTISHGALEITFRVLNIVTKASARLALASAGIGSTEVKTNVKK